MFLMLHVSCVLRMKNEIEIKHTGIYHGVKH